ncbi:MAG: PilZ domain-containing protein [Croceibacterium sp.]
MDFTGNRKQSLSLSVHARAMTARKRPTLYDRGEAARSGDRTPVRIPAHCQVGEQVPEDTFVTDISPRGCKLLAVTIGALKSQPVVLRFGDETPITGRLKWVKQASVGVAFDEALSDERLARISALVAPSNVVPIRRARFS